MQQRRKKPATAPKRRKALGQPEVWTEEQLEEMSIVTADDLLAATELWEEKAPRPLKKLLRAKEQDENE